MVSLDPSSLRRENWPTRSLPSCLAPRGPGVDGTLSAASPPTPETPLPQGLWSCGSALVGSSPKQASETPPFWKLSLKLESRGALESDGSSGSRAVPVPGTVCHCGAGDQPVPCAGFG